MNFNTTNNKAFLWKLMYDNGLFKNLDDKYAKEVHNYFDLKMNYIDNNKKGNDTLITLNKQAISEMMNDIKIKFPLHTSSSYSSPLNKVELPMPMTPKSSITSQDLLQDRQNSFTQQLKNVKDDFESLMNLKKPEIIDFTDKIDEFLIKKDVKNDDKGDDTNKDSSDIERLLAETIAKRENLVININENEKSKASQWINNNREPNNNNREPIEITNNLPFEELNNNNNDNDEIITLERVNEKKIVTKKNVRFSDELYENKDKDIQEQLKEINLKLNKIMELLEKDKI
jgi:hypothetical protein